MRNIVLGSATVLSLLGMTATAIAAEPTAQASEHVGQLLNLDSPGRIPGRYIVRFKSEASVNALPAHASKMTIGPNLRPIDAASTKQLATSFADTLGGKVTHTFEKRRKGFAVSGLSETAARSLADDPRVEYVEPIMALQFNDTQGSAPSHLDRIDQANRPLSGTYTYNATGNNVDVYVLDTGIRHTHEEFQGRAGTSVQDCVTPDGYSQACRSIYPTSPHTNGRNPDCDGHGTRVASVIGGRTFGVAKRVSLHGYIIGHSGNFDLRCSDAGDTADMNAALDHVEDEAQDSSNTIVVNLSVNVNGVSRTIEDAIRGVMNDGAVFVVGAGNDNRDACSLTPTRMPEVITVAAVNDMDARWGLSNWGSCVDLFAPGTNITAADRTSNTAVINGREGTSYSAPIVSGIVALYLETHPRASPAQVQDAIKEQATIGIVTNPGTNTPNRLAYSLVRNGTGGGTGQPPSNAKRALSIILHMILND